MFAAWVALSPAMVVLARLSPRRAALVGWLGVAVAELVRFRTVVSALTASTELGVGEVWAIGVLRAVLVSAIAGLSLAAVPALRARVGWAWIPAVALFQGALEALWPGLYPHPFGLGQWRVLPLWQVTAVAGVSGMTALLWAVNAGLAEAWLRVGEGRSWRRALVVGAAGLSLVALAGEARVLWVDARLGGAPVLRVALFQQKSAPGGSRLKQTVKGVRRLIARTASLAAGAADLALWPESVVVGDPRDTRPAFSLGKRPPREVYEELARAGGFDLVLPAVALATPGDTRPVRAAFHVRDEGGFGAAQLKNVLAPFGEASPFRDVPLLRTFFPDDRRGLQPGTEITPLTVDTPNGRFRVGVPICYENVRPDYIALLVNGGVGPEARPIDLLAAVANDDGFGGADVPWQAAALAAANATMFGLPVVRSALTGVNLVVEPTGRVVYVTEPFIEAEAVVPVRVARVQTPYLLLRPFIPWIALLTSLGVCVWAARRPSLRETTQDPG